jgi:hypothetical protein
VSGFGSTAAGHTNGRTAIAAVSGKGAVVAFLLWIAAVIIAVFGIIALLTGNIIWGIVLLIIAALVGPGGYSIFNRSHV